MATKQKITQYCSLLLRLWQEDGAGEPATRCIEVESIQSGQKWQFDNLKTMFDFLQIMSEQEPTTQSVKGRATPVGGFGNSSY